MARGVFITGTDTGVGKTVFACALLRAYVARGWRAIGMKPIAAGVAPGAECNADVAALAAAGNVDAPLAARADRIVVEGAGGVYVPLDARRDMLDVACSLALPVVLVVGVRLGCLNH